MKKLSILLLLVLLLTLLAIPASANYATGTLDTGHTWVFDEASGNLTISGTGALPDYPSSGIIQGNQAPWKSWAEQIKTVVLGEGITSTGKYSFYMLKNLTGVQLPSTLQIIDSYAFSQTAITTMTFPDSLTTVGDYAFSRCTALKELRFPASLNKMGAHVFDYCTSYANVFFLGDLPEMPDMRYPGSHLNIFYPKGNETWAEENRPAWDGDIVINSFSDCINDHTYGGWLNIKEPTADEEGIKQRICGICKHLDYATIPKLGGKTETTPSTQPTVPATQPSTPPATQPSTAPTTAAATEPSTAPTVPASPAPTPPPMPTVSMNQAGTATGLPSNLGSIIGITLAGVMVVAVVVIVILKKRK